MQQAERLLEQEKEVEKTPEELEDIARKEQARLDHAQRYERRTKEKQEKEVEDDTLEDLVAKPKSKDSKATETMQKVTDNPGKAGKGKSKNPRGKKAKQETEAIEKDIEEEEEQLEVKEVTSKRKVIGCINKEEEAGFQTYIQDKMIILVAEMKCEKNIAQPIRELIESLKLKYDRIGLFENNGVADTEEIVQSIPDGKGTAWWKHLEGKDILDPDDYNMIVEATVRSQLFQEGQLHEKIDKTILAPEMDITKAEVMARCASLFKNLAEAHEANKAVAQDLKELSTIIKDPDMFSRIVQAANPPLVACYTPRIDKFITQ